MRQKRKTEMCNNRDVMSFLDGKSIMITGITGLIGKNIATEIINYNKDLSHKPVRIVGCVRNTGKAERIFDKDIPYLSYVVGDIRQIDLPQSISVDYIIHTASQTSSKGFVENPLETIDVALRGTEKLLEYAKTQPIKKFIYLSTMEVYGTFLDDSKVDESFPAHIDTMNPRACYPESKRMCESMCASYSSQYGIPVAVLRLTQTFGRGVEYNDGRVFAEFARCAIENRDIVLLTKGLTKRNYLDVRDAVRAIMMVMSQDETCAVYNVANESTYCSIMEMAHLVADEVCSGKISVIVNEDSSNEWGFAPTLHMNLDVTKLRSRGWKPQFSLRETFSDMISYMNERKA